MRRSVTSRASLTKFKSVGYLMSAGAQVASIRMVPAFSGFGSCGAESGSPTLFGGGPSSGEESFRDNSMIFSLKRLITSAGRRFRKCVIKEALKGGFVSKLLNPRKYCRYGFSLTASTTARSLNPRISLMSNAPIATRTFNATSPRPQLLKCLA